MRRESWQLWTKQKNRQLERTAQANKPTVEHLQKEKLRAKDIKQISKHLNRRKLRRKQANKRRLRPRTLASRAEPAPLDVTKQIKYKKAEIHDQKYIFASH